jgi:hypothetical protein
MLKRISNRISSAAARVLTVGSKPEFPFDWERFLRLWLDWVEAEGQLEGCEFSDKMGLCGNYHMRFDVDAREAFKVYEYMKHTFDGNPYPFGADYWTTPSWANWERLKWVTEELKRIEAARLAQAMSQPPADA